MKDVGSKFLLLMYENTDKLGLVSFVKTLVYDVIYW